jgi:succinate dehydrogenase / fumarate reductase membrane anchor subunit
MRNRTVPQPAMSFEYIMWMFTRISGLALLFLGSIGMVMAFAMGGRELLDLPTLVRWTFFPNPNHVVNSDIPDVTQGWANAYWQIMQIVIAFFGISHGFNGLRVVIEDYIGNTIWQPMLRGLIFLVWLFFMIMAVFVILAS